MAGQWRERSHKERIGLSENNSKFGSRERDREHMARRGKVPKTQRRTMS